MPHSDCLQCSNPSFNGVHTCALGAVISPALHDRLVSAIDSLTESVDRLARNIARESDLTDLRQSLLS